MSADARTVLSEALALPDAERADIAAELIASLDEAHSDDPAMDQALWREEIKRRAQRAVAGESDDDDWYSLHRRLADDLTSGDSSSPVRPPGRG